MDHGRHRCKPVTRGISRNEAHTRIRWQGAVPAEGRVPGTVFESDGSDSRNRPMPDPILPFAARAATGGPLDDPYRVTPGGLNVGTQRALYFEKFQQQIADTLRLVMLDPVGRALEISDTSVVTKPSAGISKFALRKPVLGAPNHQGWHTYPELVARRHLLSQ